MTLAFSHGLHGFVLFTGAGRGSSAGEISFIPCRLDLVSVVTWNSAEHKVRL